MLKIVTDHCRVVGATAYCAECSTIWCTSEGAHGGSLMATASKRRSPLTLGSIAVIGVGPELIARVSAGGSCLVNG